MTGALDERTGTARTQGLTRLAPLIVGGIAKRIPPFTRRGTNGAMRLGVAPYSLCSTRPRATCRKIQNGHRPRSTTTRHIDPPSGLETAEPMEMSGEYRINAARDSLACAERSGILEASRLPVAQGTSEPR
jgi:hypothetical protein